MKVKDAAIQAFPFIEPNDDDAIKAYHPGMTMRDEFAKAAMQISYKYWNEDFFNPNHFDKEERVEQSKDFDESMMELIAIWSYKMADAMMKARKA